MLVRISIKSIRFFWICLISNLVFIKLSKIEIGCLNKVCNNNCQMTMIWLNCVDRNVLKIFQHISFIVFCCIVYIVIPFQRFNLNSQCKIHSTQIVFQKLSAWIFFHVYFDFFDC